MITMTLRVTVDTTDPQAADAIERSINHGMLQADIEHYVCERGVAAQGVCIEIVPDDRIEIPMSGPCVCDGTGAVASAGGFDACPSGCESARAEGTVSPCEATAEDGKADHNSDADCIPYLVDGQCTACGVGNGPPCQSCGGERYHEDDCAAECA